MQSFHACFRPQKSLFSKNNWKFFLFRIASRWLYFKLLFMDFFGKNIHYSLNQNRLLFWNHSYQFKIFLYNNTFFFLVWMNEHKKIENHSMISLNIIQFKDEFFRILFNNKFSNIVNVSIIFFVKKSSFFSIHSYLYADSNEIVKLINRYHDLRSNLRGQRIERFL